MTKQASICFIYWWNSQSFHRKKTLKFSNNFKVKSLYITGLNCKYKVFSLHLIIQNDRLVDSSAGTSSGAEICHRLLCVFGEHTGTFTSVWMIQASLLGRSLTLMARWLRKFPNCSEEIKRSRSEGPDGNQMKHLKQIGKFVVAGDYVEK